MDSIGENYVALKRQVAELEQRCADYDANEKRISALWAEDTARAAQAERERDFAKSAAARYEKRLGADLKRWVWEDDGALAFNWTPADVARLQADNAALLEAYRRTWGCVMHDNVLHSPACNASDDALGICTPECPALYVSNLLKAEHPGAALLERLRALEVVEEVATEALGALSLPSGPACDQARAGARDRLQAALAAYDALKERG